MQDTAQPIPLVHRKITIGTLKTLVPLPPFPNIQSPHHILARPNSTGTQVAGLEEEEEEEEKTAMRAPKRRRSVRVDGKQVPLGASSGMDLESLDDLDLISRLPDDLLGTVVSLLPTKEGARTQAVVSKILSDHPGPARRFSIHIIPHRGLRAKVAPWFLSETLTAGLQELEVTNPRRKCYPLPRHALTRFAPTLRLLKLSGCRRLRELPPSFPRLKQLILYDVGISDDSLQRVISSCAVLESLSLRSVRFGRLCISSQTLRSIDLHALRSKGLELLIEDALV